MENPGETGKHNRRHSKENRADKPKPNNWGKRGIEEPKRITVTRYNLNTAQNRFIRNNQFIFLLELDRVHESRESENAIYRSIIRENVGCLRDLKTSLQE